MKQKLGHAQILLMIAQTVRGGSSTDEQTLWSGDLEAGMRGGSVISHPNLNSILLGRMGPYQFFETLFRKTHSVIGVGLEDDTSKYFMFSLV